jgi:oxygen-independent coproporphyrinogen-3 oxidase
MEFAARRRAWPELFGALETLYFGGGTPSLLTPAFYAEFIDFLAAESGFTEDAEITLEANPADLTRERAVGYRSAGINRLSLGVQTFAAAGLARLGRRHDAAGARAAVAAARAAGCGNLNLDLIIAWPGQTEKELADDLAEVEALLPEHLSCYLLTLEPDTPLGRQVAAGRLRLPGEELQTALLERVRQELGAAGYLHYEVSNYARKPEFRSRHNLAVWHLADYLGLGAGACGARHLGAEHPGWIERYRNHPEPNRYLTVLADNTGQMAAPAGRLDSSWCEREIVNRRQALVEAVMLGLRLREGILLPRLAREFGPEAVAGLRRRARPLLRDGLLELGPTPAGERLRIAVSGLWLSDEIILRLI